MKRVLLAGAALAVAGSMAFTMALAKDAVRHKPRLDKDGRPLSSRSVAYRTKLCKADCSPQKYDEKTGVGIHGIYRSYHQYDPQLVSVRGKKEYAECVSKCLGPLPSVYVQRPLLAMGMNWFGKSKESCLDCHVKGH
jgi:hypothetical protein